MLSAQFLQSCRRKGGDRGSVVGAQAFLVRQSIEVQYQQWDDCQLLEKRFHFLPKVTTLNSIINMNTTKDKISLVCKASLGSSTTNPTHRGQQKGPELQGHIHEQNKRGRASLLSRKDAGTKMLSYRLSVVPWGMALPPHTSMGRCSKAFLWSLAVLPALCKIQLKTEVPTLKCLHGDVNTWAQRVTQLPPQRLLMLLEMLQEIWDTYKEVADATQDLPVQHIEIWNNILKHPAWHSALSATRPCPRLFKFPIQSRNSRK